MMRKSPMGLFFNDASPDFMPRWRTIREKGFRWFYIRHVPRLFLFMAVIFVINNLIERQIPFSGSDSVAVLAIFALLSAGISLLLWRKYESVYRRRAEKRKVLHGGRK